MSMLNESINTVSLFNIQGVPSSISEVKNNSIKTISNGQANFSGWLSDNISQLDHSLKASNQVVHDIALGNPVNTHEAMITMENARLSFQLAIEVRNKLLESYQEVMRMQL